MKLSVVVCLTLMSGACAHTQTNRETPRREAVDVLRQAFNEVGPKPYPAWKAPEDFCLSLHSPTEAEATAFVASVEVWEDAVCDRFNALADDGWSCRRLTETERDSGSTCWPEPYPRCGERTTLVLMDRGRRFEARIVPVDGKRVNWRVQTALWPARCEIDSPLQEELYEEVRKTLLNSFLGLRTSTGCTDATIMGEEFQTEVCEDFNSTDVAKAGGWTCRLITAEETTEKQCCGMRECGIGFSVVLERGGQRHKGWVTPTGPISGVCLWPKDGTCGK